MGTRHNLLKSCFFLCVFPANQTSQLSRYLCLLMANSSSDAGIRSMGHEKPLSQRLQREGMRLRCIPPSYLLRGCAGLAESHDQRPLLLCQWTSLHSSGLPRPGSGNSPVIRSSRILYHLSPYPQTAFSFFNSLFIKPLFASLSQQVIA